MKARYQESKEESDGITLEDFDFSDDKHCVGKREDQDRLVKKTESTSSSSSKDDNGLEEFSNNHFVVLDTDANQEVERGRNVDDEDEKNKKEEGDEKSAEAGSESESPKSDKSTATDHEHSATKKRKRGGSSLSDEERRKRNTEASARFRVKRRMREQEMSERLTKIRAHIAELKVKEKTLSMENECLKRMLLGDAAVGAMLTSKDASAQPAIDTMSNYQLLNLMRQKSGEGFRITTV
ncbi:DEBR0S7_01530g1_1 [Brettanomyces bruxellensis]|uniref:DEBR0S7_01530g1_1 n=1 Tax=Dekkera bruxellensis TaxID=5007 RepID=A0A7D9D1Z9_DEKBR|nr:DEBR0S7_01530g1_1 [Brettanomyces bruxellensis]